jgi:tryptophan synthase alpha chain
MSSRIEQLFQQKHQKILSIYCTAGYPKLNSTLEIMQALESSGANMIELGIPYSDPLADGPIIQMSSAQALQNGMTIQKLFEQLQQLRTFISLPVILMGYMNPVLQYGFEKFCAHAAACGIDGLILPDLPEYEFETEYAAILKKHQLNFIFLITPETSEERVKQLDHLSSGFLYAVSSSSTTGNEQNFSQVAAYLQRLQSYHLNNPVLVGFGVKDKQSFESVCAYAQGAIIGSAYIRALQNNPNIAMATKQFLHGILN